MFTVNDKRNVITNSAKINIRHCIQNIVLFVGGGGELIPLHPALAAPLSTMCVC